MIADCRGLAAQPAGWAPDRASYQPYAYELLPAVLSGAGPLPAELGRNGTSIALGRISWRLRTITLQSARLVSFDWTKVLRRIHETGCRYALSVGGTHIRLARDRNRTEGGCSDGARGSLLS